MIKQQLNGRSTQTEQVFTYTSGGTASHTIIVLNDVQGEFVGGETITALNSRTGTVQFDSLGCSFEQKNFNQTKGISMDSTTYC